MTREKQICNQSVRYTKETHSPSSVSECQAAMNIAVVKAFTAGAQWADKTMLQEVLEWLKKHTYSIHYRKEHCDFGINFESEEEMIQTFKKQFNIE